MESLCMMHDMSISQGAEVQNCGITMGISDPLQLMRYSFQRFIPGYPGEFASTSGSTPFKGIEKTVGSINTLAIGTASRTHPV
jgi:hypothetical protein